jgi:tetratricopeptide (TPR) repeat protein
LWRTAPITTETVIESGRDLVGTLIPGPALLARVKAAATAGADWLPVLHELVTTKTSLPPDATLRQAGVFMQVCRVLGAVARRRPLMIVLEDLHWADSGSIALLFHLGRELNAHPILVLGSYRPTDVALGRAKERHPLEAVVAELKGRQAELILELDQAGNRGFVDALVDREPNRLGRAFRTALYRQTAGHALFTVEVLRTMKHRGMLVQDPDNLWLEGEDLDWDQLPERVDGVIAARIQRLPGELRDLLTVAAVEGEEFTSDVIARILGIEAKQVSRTLSRELEDRHRLVRAVGVRTLPDRRLSVFGFSHVLFRRHLYSSLNEVDRVQLHHDVALALEELFSHDTEEIAVRLAHHFEQAGVTDRAIHYLRQSGVSATRMTANREAVDHLTRAFQLLETLPESRERDRIELTLQFALQGPWSGLQGWAGPEVSRAVERASALAEKVGDQTQRAWVLYLTGSLYTTNGRVPEIAEVAKRLRKLAGSMGDEAFGLMADALTSYWATYTGRFSTGLDGWKSVIERYDPKRHRWIAHAGGGDPAVLGHAHIALLLARMGFLDQCLEWFDRGMELAETVGHHNSTCHLMTVGFGCRAYRYEFDRAEALVERTFELASEHGFEHWIVACEAWRGQLRVVQGDVKGGVALISENLDRLRGLGFEGFTIDLLCGLALGYLAGGRLDEAMASLDEALDAVNRQRPHLMEPEVHRHRGDVHLATGAAADAEADYRKAVTLSQSQSAGLFELFAVSRLAGLQRAQGRFDEARNILAPVLRRFTEGLDTPPLIEARALLYELENQNE